MILHYKGIEIRSDNAEELANVFILIANTEYQEQYVVGLLLAERMAVEGLPTDDRHF